MDKVIEFNLASVEAGTKQQSNENTQYIREGAYNCEITSIETSKSRENYNGAPYITFNVKSGDKLGRAKFWAVRESDKPSSKEWKAKQIKEFLINCGITDFSNEATAIKEAIGKKVNITFTYEEYVTKHRETGEPLIRKAVKYRWSSKDGEKIIYKDEYNQTLSKEDMSKYMAEKQEFENSNSNIESVEQDTEDLPF